MSTTRRATLVALAALAACTVLPTSQPADAGRTVQRTPGVEVGQTPPDFTLRMLNSDETVQLSERIGKRPVVLVFGSYT